MSSGFHGYEERHTSFCRTYNIQGKRCTWPYKVIPTKAMAQLGFEYQPTFVDDTLMRDNVVCSFCQHATYDFRECRSKPLTATLSKVLDKHLKASPECLYSALKLVLILSYLKAEPVKWSEHAHWKTPHTSEMIHLRQWTFKEGWIQECFPSLSAASMAKAGLLRYDLAMASFEVQEGHQDATYCIYCSKIIGSWEAEDDPMWEHFVCCNGGRCLFFETLADKDLLERMKSRYIEEGFELDGNALPSLDYYETFGAQLKRFEEQSSVEESGVKKGRPRSSSATEPLPEPKKRGRPRKVLQPSPNDDSSVPNVHGILVERPQDPNIKRKRGRPKKVLDNNAAPTQPKRPRGRPKKETVLSAGTPLNSDESPPGTSGEHAFERLNDAKTSAPSPSNENTPRPTSHSSKESHGSLMEPASNNATEKLAGLDISTTSPKRRIKLRPRSRNQQEQDDLDSDEDSTKSIVLNFKVPSPEGKKITARNPIIDDSFDAFSFSAHGNSEFVIPDTAFLTKSSKKKSTSPSINQEKTPLQVDGLSRASGDETKSSTKYQENRIINDRTLDAIDMDVEMSDDSEEGVSLSQASTPVNSPISHNFERLSGDLTKTPTNCTQQNLLSGNDDMTNESLAIINNDNHRHPQLNLLKKIASVDETERLLEGQKPVKLGSVASWRNSLDRELTGTNTSFKRLSMNSDQEAQNLPNEESTAIIKKQEVTEAASSLQRHGSFSESPSLDLNKSNRHARKSTSQLLSFERRTPGSNHNGHSGDNKDPYEKIDEARNLLGSYFHNLLRYINVNDATLSNEKDGDLDFFIKHMPEEEKALTFQAWIDKKKSALQQEFEKDYKTKIAILEKQFKTAQSFLEKIENEDVLLQMADRFGIPTSDL